MDVKGSFHGALCRADEWGLPRVIVSIGVRAAFGSLIPSHVARQLGSHGATRLQVAAVLREMVGARVQPRMGQVRGGGWRTMERGVLQVT